MSDTVIKVENLSKFYQLGLIGGGRLVDDLNRWWARVRHKPDPLLKIGEKDHGNRNDGYIWALRDINFEVKQGEVLGIIGKNGAGKSTLLKILSHITSPTSGQVKIKGRIGALLEVGTGFHPELTGRENVYLNGAILGMTKAEVNRKFDEIVDFSGVEQFIDTPVKRYSSGMKVRLAFAVAAHLDPEILVIDEVLAVGDAEFQKKCLGKMGDVAKEGRTVLFVSHNMGAVTHLCSKGMLLISGKMDLIENVSSVVDKYIGSFQRDLKRTTEFINSNVGGAELSLQIINNKGIMTDSLCSGESMIFLISIKYNKAIKNVAFGLGIEDHLQHRILTFHTRYQLNESWDLNRSAFISLKWDKVILASGNYKMIAALYASNELLATWNDLGNINIIESDFYGTGKLPDTRYQGKILTEAEWTIFENKCDQQLRKL